MDAMEAENLLKKLDRRLQNVEQILPTLATREETVTHERLEVVIARLAAKDDLAAAIAPLATKAEVREEGERTRRHIDAAAESLRDDIRLIAESQVALQAEVRRGRKDLDGILKNHEKRITRLEASDARKRTRKRR